MSLSAVIKRLADIIISISAIVILWPLMLIIALAILLTSGAPVFFLQERIGLHGKPFRIIKYRTMRIDAEATGPQLSNEYDQRVTRIGLYLRRYRIDELPQFINILKGDMSMVGPRPERAYYIEQLTKRTSDHARLLQMRPGLTSWGQIRYGYASTVEEMAERMKYDLEYVEKFSLLFDLKIILHTFRIVFSGKGV